MLTVVTWPLTRLIPYVRNPRRNDDAVGKMCAAIREFGFRIPVVARSDGTVVDGHLRLKAAQRLGLDEVPVALADDLSEAQIKAFRLLANRSAAWAEWDDGLLTLELQDLRASATTCRRAAEPARRQPRHWAHRRGRRARDAGLARHSSGRADPARPSSASLRRCHACGGRRPPA